MGRLFGTDGVRGVANTELTVEIAFMLGKYGALVLAGENKHKPKILIGSDTRISCPMLESAMVAGICSAGADAYICGVIPTPGIAKLVSLFEYDAGVVISASHNSYEFNGIKFFDKNGYKLSDAIEDRIESLILNTDSNSIELPEGSEIGNRYFWNDAGLEYAKYLKSAVPLKISGVKLAIDCANGATAYIAQNVFEDLGAQVVSMGDKPDGININDNCGSTHPEKLSELVLKEKCDLGIAFDGDGDRMLAVDSDGELVDGDVIMAILSLDMKRRNALKNNTLVVTVMSNFGLDIFAQENGIVLEKTKVGDRYVLEKMTEHGYKIGGEQSGHLIFSDYATTGDGLLSALKILEAITGSGKNLKELKCIMRVMPQVLKGVKVKNDIKETALEDLELNEEKKRIEKTLDGKGRVLVRASGTEPLIRIMLEGEDFEQINEMCDKLTDIVSRKYST